MATIREITYMVLDELKNSSDDRYFEEEHVIFLMGKYRSFLLKQRYSDIKKFVPESNYQTINLPLMQVPAICGEPCEGGTYLKSKDKIPFPMWIGATRVTPIDFFAKEIAYVSRERFRYVGHNKWQPNAIYCTIGPDQYLYFKSSNPQFLYLEEVKMTAVFSDYENAYKLAGLKDPCSEESPDNPRDVPCDFTQTEFPIETALIPPLIELIVKELLGALYKPNDDTNNAKDDLSEVAATQK